MIETDYLVVGAGMAGIGFVDELLEVSDADVVILDRRHGPGGHWLDSYPFVRLHQPSPWYGVGSTPLGDERLEAGGPEQGHYTRATGTEVQEYFARLMQERFLASGRVRFFPRTDYLGDGCFRSVLGGPATEITVRRKIVDATATASRVPQRFAPPFEVADDVRLVTPNELARLEGDVPAVVIVGAGKTAFDTIVWLLGTGYPPERITWIRSRDAWLNNRHFLQPGQLSRLTVEGTVGILESLATAGTLDEALAEMETREILVRIDPHVWPTVFRGPTIADWEIRELRRIDRVVRLGKVLRIARGRIQLEQGDIPTTPATVHVHCAAPGLPDPGAVPVFAEDRITVQCLTRASIPMSSAAIARVEALDVPVEEKNRLCPPSFLDGRPLSYFQMLLQGLATENLWRGHPDLQAWFNSSRTNATRTLPGQEREPERQALHGRLIEAIGPAFESLARFGGQAT